MQGVGFRPAVYRQAVARGLTGFVRNDPQGVTVEVEGDEADIDDFFARLTLDTPEQSRIARVVRRKLPPKGYARFEVGASEGLGQVKVHLPPDLAVCGRCLAELDDPTDRRYRYPFTNCVDCGPRFTIVDRLPYDRPATSMRRFALCPECEAEYHDPEDRRFHAEPNACAHCGPHLFLLPRDGARTVEGETALRHAQGIIRGGGIVAVKGLGGYHLACDALAPAAVARLRQRKHRPAKSLAVMFRDMATLKAHLTPAPAEERELLSSARPIVVLRGRLSGEVSPDTETTGVFLPYAPLHALLLQPFEALVLTSGNRRDEPLACDEVEALRLLDGIADAVLAHDRAIVHRCDDSVVQVVDGQRCVFRRARGYVPTPLRIAADSPAILATGADMKSTFCLVNRGQAFVSQHIGELSDHSTYRHYREEIERWQSLLRIAPSLVAHDLHPRYLSTRYATERQGATLVGVQHHHAHVAAVMAECGLSEPVIGVALDGTGYGTDGTVWGGEILLADRACFERMAHFKTYRMPGGEKAIEEPWRMALSIARAEGLAWSPDIPAVERSKIAGLERMLESDVACPVTSSAGRMFDAVAALLDLCSVAGYEAQGAIRLEAAADVATTGEYPFVLELEPAPWVLDFGPALARLLADKSRGVPVGVMAGRFHNTVVHAVVEACIEISRPRGVGDVALCGGVFLNRLVLSGIALRLRDAGLRVHVNTAVPANDGGVSLGQAAVALARAERGLLPCV